MSLSKLRSSSLSKHDGLGFSKTLMFLRIAIFVHAVLFPIKTFDASNLTRQVEMLFEIIDIDFQCLVRDVRHILCVKNVSNALVLLIEFWQDDVPQWSESKPSSWPQTCGILIIVLATLQTHSRNNRLSTRRRQTRLTAVNRCA